MRAPPIWMMRGHDRKFPQSQKQWKRDGMGVQYKGSEQRTSKLRRGKGLLPGPEKCLKGETGRE
jgi:hypothetical protein